MTPPADMLFKLRDLPESREFSLAQEFLRDALAAIPGQSTLEDSELGSVKVAVEVVEEQGTVLASGSVLGSAKVACSRCLGAVTLTIDDQFVLTFLPHDQLAENQADADDVEVDAEDVDVASHDGKQVDIARVLRDHVVLSVPYAPLCSEDCKGLCSSCGADLNESSCECPAAADESPWTALKDFKPKASS